MFNSVGQFCNGFFNYGRVQPGGYIMMGIGLIIIIVLIYFVLKKGSLVNHDRSDSPLDLLQKRFVSGEIEEDEFLNKKKILENK